MVCVRSEGATGETTIRFEVDDGLANQLGAIQGGAVATLLNGCIGIAGAAGSGGVLAMPLAELNVTTLPLSRTPVSQTHVGNPWA